MNSGIITLALTNKTLGLELDYHPALTEAVGDGMDELPIDRSLAYSLREPSVSPDFECLLRVISEERAELL